MQWLRRTFLTRPLSAMLIALIVVLMLLPVVVVIGMSFNGTSFVSFPPDSFSGRQYSNLIHSSYWHQAILKSFAIAIPAAAAATVIGTMAVLAIQRSVLRLRGVLQLFALLPLLFPAVAYAFALYTMFAKLHVFGSLIGLIAVDCMLGIPFVVVICGASLVRIPARLEVVAMTLGASRSRALIGITCRLLLPAIAASFVFAFLVSFDDATFITFLGGPGLVTLPEAVFASLKTGLDPTIAPIAAVFMLITVTAVAAATHASRRELTS